MTIMKIYNRNGHGDEPQSSAYRYSDMVRDFFGNSFTEKAPYTKPAYNILEEKDSYVLSLAVPGLNKSEINLNLEKNILHVSHKTENEISTGGYARKEFDYKNFERSFELPETVNQEKIKASYEDGILHIRLPKRDEVIDRGPKEIKVS